MQKPGLIGGLRMVELVSEHAEKSAPNKKSCRNVRERAHITQPHLLGVVKGRCNQNRL